MCMFGVLIICLLWGRRYMAVAFICPLLVSSFSFRFMLRATHFFFRGVISLFPGSSWLSLKIEIHVCSQFVKDAPQPLAKDRNRQRGWVHRFGNPNHDPDQIFVRLCPEKAWVHRRYFVNAKMHPQVVFLRYLPQFKPPREDHICQLCIQRT